MCACGTVFYAIRIYALQFKLQVSSLTLLAPTIRFPSLLEDLPEFLRLHVSYEGKPCAETDVERNEMRAKN